jgi:hypothetical protein
MPKCEEMITFRCRGGFPPEGEINRDRYGRYVGWRDTGKLSSLAK